jgi:hypothetical protein
VFDCQPVPFRIQMVGAYAGYDREFAAIVRTFQPKAPVNNVYTADVTFKPSGDITLVAPEPEPKPEP